MMVEKDKLKFNGDLQDLSRCLVGLPTQLIHRSVLMQIPQSSS